MDSRPGLSRSKTTGYAAASYSRPVRPAAAPIAAKPLPGVPGGGLQRSNTNAGANVQRSNTNPGGLGLSNTNVRYIQTSGKLPIGTTKVLPAVAGKTLPSLPPGRGGIPPTAMRAVQDATVKRSNTTPTPMRSNTVTAGSRSRPPVTTSRSTQQQQIPAFTRGGGGAPPPPPKASGSGALSRSKSENQRPGQTYANRAEAVKALKAPLPPIPQGAIAKNLVLASEDNARVLDSGLPNLTSSHIVRVAESNGECLKEASRALYGRHAAVEDRIIWNRTAESDRGMKALLEWIDKVRWGLASLGLHKFVSTKSRGALVFNINGRLSNSPETPAVDWLTFEDAQRTLDIQLQTYISTYDPTAHVLVYAFRVMPGGNTLHIWGKKLTIPQSLPTTHATEIKEALKKINKRKHAVLVEDAPTNSGGPLRKLSMKWLKRKLSGN